MKKIIILIGIILTSQVFAGDQPATVIINALQDKQPAVTFTHKAHADRLKGKCAECHVKGGVALKPAFTDAKGKGQMKNAYHAECIGCHKKSKAPTACAACHKK